MNTEPPQSHESGPESSFAPPDDGLPPLQSLAELQDSVARGYAKILAFVTELHCNAAEQDAQGLNIVLARLQNDSSWAVSEVFRDNEFKLRRQRYISQDVFDLWQACSSRPGSRPAKFDVDALGKTLTHEHVIQRKGIGEVIRSNATEQELLTTLKGVTACVVTRAEDLRLRPWRELDGWARYRRAEPPVGVYDRLNRVWVVPRSGPDT